MNARERARHINYVGKTPKEIYEEIEQAIIAAEEAKVKEEREACARIAKYVKETHQGLKKDQGAHAAFLIENLIRARSEGEKKGE